MFSERKKAVLALTTFHILTFKWILSESPQEHPQIYYRKVCCSFSFLEKCLATLVVSWRHRWFLRQSVAGFAGSQQEFSVFWIHLKLVNKGKDTQTSFFHCFLFYFFWDKVSLSIFSWSGTPSLKTRLCLQSAGIQCVCCHAWPLLDDYWNVVSSPPPS